MIQIAASTAWYQVMIGRFVAGLGVGALSLLVPMYQAETAPPWIRGALISTYQLIHYVGDLPCRMLQLRCIRASAPQFSFVENRHWARLGLDPHPWLWVSLLFPETPRYAYRMGRVQEAKETLMKVYGAPAHHYAVHTQLEEIEAKLKAESQIKGNAITETTNMFKAPRMSLSNRSRCYASGSAAAYWR